MDTSIIACVVAIDHCITTAVVCEGLTGEQTPLCQSSIISRSECLFAVKLSNQSPIGILYMVWMDACPLSYVVESQTSHLLLCIGNASSVPRITDIKRMILARIGRVASPMDVECVGVPSSGPNDWDECGVEVPRYAPARLAYRGEGWGEYWVEQHSGCCNEPPKSNPACLHYVKCSMLDRSGTISAVLERDVNAKWTILHLRRFRTTLKRWLDMTGMVQVDWYRKWRMDNTSWSWWGSSLSSHQGDSTQVATNNEDKVESKIGPYCNSIIMLCGVTACENWTFSIIIKIKSVL